MVQRERAPEEQMNPEVTWAYKTHVMENHQPATCCQLIQHPELL